MAPLHLKLLGGFSAHESRGRAIDVSGRKNQALLAYLVLNPGRKITREKLLGLLWGERAEAQARASLRQALAVLRRDLEEIEPDALMLEGDSVGVEPAAIATDVTRFERLASSDAAEDLREAARLYEGDLLDGIAIRDPVFEEWLSAERGRLRETAIGCLTRLLERQPAPEAIATGRRLLALDPLREASHRALMRVYAANGQRDQALRQYRACRDLLRKELQVEPSKETEVLRREIETGGEPTATAQSHKTTETERRPALPLPDRPSIAVLPFENLSGDPEQAYFADGLTEDLITDLSKVLGLFVIARNSSFVYKGTEADVRQIARELGVQYVLEGSARRAANRVRINVQLIDALGGGHLWVDRFDRDLVDIFAVQDEVVAKIVEALAARLTAAGLRERYRPASLEAYDLCVRGRAQWVHSVDAGVAARPLFERAIQLDPNYSEAYRYLATGHCMSWLHMGGPMHPFREQAVSLARKAVDLDPNDSGAHWMLALIILYERLWDESEREFELALRLNPNDADAWSNLSDLKVMEGKGTEAVDCCQKALRLNPHPSSSYYWDLGQARYAAGNYEAAIQALRHESTYRTSSRRILAAALAQIGRLEEARLEARLFLANNPHFKLGHWIETQPFRDLAMKNKFIEGYRMAGLPE
jgi:TolB-like protein/Tfp pilus assembly protein PilF